MTTLSLRFSQADYSKLREEAAALGLRPAVLARVIIRTSLNAPHEERRRSGRRQFTAALERLNALTGSGGGGPVDAVEVIRGARQRREAQLTEVLAPETSAG